MQIIIGSGYPKIVTPLIDNAITGIDILMYHWGYYPNISKTPAHQLSYSIKSAIMRGVPVRVLLHCGSPSDGLRLKNSRTANQLKTWGAQVKFYKRGGVLHSKLVLVDRTFAICGSHNISKNSMTSNVETSVLLEGSGDIRPLQDYFNLLWGQN